MSLTGHQSCRGRLARRIGARVTALTVLPPFHALTTDTQMLEDTLDQYHARMREHADGTWRARPSGEKARRRVRVDPVEDEHPYRAIIDAAESKGCDLIVMASHGRRGIAAIVLGSETVKVLTHSKIPVLIHR